METAARWLQERLGCQIGDPALLRLALTHRSHGSANNERLEFLGDAVLSFIVAEMLCDEFPEASEGELSRFRASLVSGATLGELGQELGLGEHLNLGEGELKSGGFRRASILADALEAIIGALYLDGGMVAVRDLVQRLLAARLAALPEAAALKDPKTRLQEWLQARGLALPAYTVMAISGEPHRQRFKVRCEIIELALTAEADANSRRAAEQQAAHQLLERPELSARS